MFMICFVHKNSTTYDFFFTRLI